MMCDSPEELREAADWPGKGNKSRQDLMDKLQGKGSLHSISVWSKISLACSLQTIGLE